MTKLLRIDVDLRVNGEVHEARVALRRDPADDLARAASVDGGQGGAATRGVCGACTVIIDGLAVRSCLALTANCGDQQITSVEGLAPPGQPTALQSAFMTMGAVQCGFCSPGFLMVLTALFRRMPSAQTPEIREAISGNLCRCSGYAKIVEAALSVSEATDPPAREAH